MVLETFNEMLRRDLSKTLENNCVVHVTVD